MERGDLHIHTSASDGALSPAEVVRRARAAGMAFIAITDHNSLAGLLPAEAALEEPGLRLVRGIELSAQPEADGEIHILGYGTRPDSPALQEVCAELRRRKWEQLRAILVRLRALGVQVDDSDLPSREPGEESYIGRPVLAKVLLDAGVVGTFNQAFSRYLGAEGRAFVPMRPFSPEACIRAIHAAGGLALLAHPTVDLVDRWIERLVKMGLDGVEAFRPALAGNEQLYIEKVAEHFGLLVTGGSDWHGRPGEPPLGSFCVQDVQVCRFLEALRGR